MPHSPILIDEFKPSPKLLAQNRLECENCSFLMGLSDLEPLKLAKCPECEHATFVPYCVNGFWLYRPLGGGGMGSVYKAIHPMNQDLEFAVKILPRLKRQDPYLIQALLSEGEIGFKFGRHPHLISVVDYGLSGDEHYLVMELMSGKRLDKVIEEQNKISPKYVLLWGLQVLSAEQHMYNCGYLYRDLKPQNMIIDASGNAHVFDFGLCMTLDVARAEKTDSVEGSPQYMPPERIIGAGEDMPSEIYSLGMILFHAISGETYYTATTALDLAKKHISSLRFASTTTRLPPDTDPRVSHLIDKMIARSPKERFRTYKDCGAAINSLFNDLKK